MADAIHYLSNAINSVVDGIHSIANAIYSVANPIYSVAYAIHSVAAIADIIDIIGVADPDDSNINPLKRSSGLKVNLSNYR